jgi:hypothetical protein
MAADALAGTPYASGLVRWYHFDLVGTDKTTFLRDDSGNGEDATCSSTACPRFIPDGRVGGAADFDGLTDYVVAGKITPSSTGTVAFWFRADRTNKLQRLMGGADAFEISLQSDARLGNHLYAANDEFLESGAVAAGAWRHAVFTYNAGTHRQEIYLDGQLVASGQAANDSPGTLTLAIGTMRAKSGYFDGAIDEFALWNRVLSSAEVTAVYLNTQTGSGGGSDGGSDGGGDTSGPDTTAPTVSLTAPTAGSYLSGATTLKAAASDNVGVTRVRFIVDGDVVDRDTSAPFEITWDASSVPGGSHTITAVANDAAGNTTTSAPVEVTTGSSQPSGGNDPLPPPPPTGDWNRVISDTLVNGNLVIPAGQRWLIGKNVQVAGNVLVEDAVMGMRPGSSLKIVGADPNKYIGGGAHYTSSLNSDRGVWVWGSGQLDIACTPKTSWNRTGVDPSWSPGDEYWITATAVGDRKPRRWSFGQAIPRANTRVPAAEVMNVTRDCVIEGPGHIHIHSTRSQRVEYVRLQGLGISNRASGGAVLGRYALHMHFSGDGTRGTIVRGVAAVGSQGTVYVPHASHGITMIDNVSVNSFGEGLWWDLGDRTDDLLVDRLAVAGVEMPRDLTGLTSRIDAYRLGAGVNTQLRNSVASGACCVYESVGFDWPSEVIKDDINVGVVWVFNQGNVAHNNSGPGIRFWTNGRDNHLVENYVGYRNGSQGGIELGAYRNGVQHRDILLVDDFIRHNSSPKLNQDGQPPHWLRCDVTAPTGKPAVTIGHRKQPPEDGVYIEFIDCKLNGTPKVFIESQTNPTRLKFIRSGVTPDDVVFESGGGGEGSHIIIDNGSSGRWEIRITNGKKVVKQM